MALSDELTARKNQKINEKDILIRRSRGVERIMGGIYRDFTFIIANLWKIMSDCAEAYSYGLSGKKKEIVTDIEQEYEEDRTSDAKLCSSYSSLWEELVRCQTKAVTLQNEIDSLDSQIAVAKQQEEDARRREYEAYMASINGGNES